MGTITFGRRTWPTNTTSLRQSGGVLDLAPLARLPDLRELCLHDVKRSKLRHSTVSKKFLSKLSPEQLVEWDALLESGLSEDSAQTAA